MLSSVHPALSLVGFLAAPLMPSSIQKAGIFMLNPLVAQTLLCF